MSNHNHNSPQSQKPLDDKELLELRRETILNTLHNIQSNLIRTELQLIDYKCQIETWTKELNATKEKLSNLKGVSDANR